VPGRRDVIGSHIRSSEARHRCGSFRGAGKRCREVAIVARQVFFSFHYARDIWRVNQVRKSNSFQNSGDEAVYWDHSLWEETKKKGDDALRMLIDTGLKGASVTAVLIGAETSTRRWVKYEIEKSYDADKGLFGVYIHRLEDVLGKTDSKGANPFGVIQIPGGGGQVSLAGFCSTYDWVADDGPKNFASWVERAAKAAGR
jgi:hypothetical protein